MSKLAEFRQLEKHLVYQVQALEVLKGDAGFKKKIEFESKLRDLLAKYGYSLRDVMNLLDPRLVDEHYLSKPHLALVSLAR